MDRFDRRAAARAGLAGLAVDLQRQRQLVGDRQLDDLLVVLERRVERRHDRFAQRRRLVRIEVVAALERRQPRGPEDLVDPRPTDPRDDALVAQERVQRAWRVEQRAQVGGRVGPRLRPERRDDGLRADGIGREQLDPRRLARAELPQSQLAPAFDPHEQPRGPVAQARALVVELHPPGAHEVREQHELPADIDGEVLADPPDAFDRAALKRRQRRVEGLQRVDARRGRRLDRRAGKRLGKPPCRDLHLR